MSILKRYRKSEFCRCPTPVLRRSVTLGMMGGLLLVAGSLRQTMSAHQDDLSPAAGDEVAEVEGSWDSSVMAAELTRLAEICERLGLEEEADISRNWLPTLRPDQQFFFLPLEMSPESSRPHADSWYKRFIQARQRYAEHLYSQCQSKIIDGDESLAYRLLWQALRENPQHPQASRAIGQPLTAISLRPLQRGSFTLPEFPRSGNFQRWQSRHFEVYSRMNAKATTETVQAMERFFLIWLQAFYELWAPPGLLNARLNGSATAWPEFNKLQVVLFADRNEYIQALGVMEANISASTGYYNPATQRCYFYYAGEQLDTIYHELTHQMLAEIPRWRSPIELDKVPGAWAIEGIALYMESLKRKGHWWSLGGVESPRLQTARYRAVRNSYWPDWQQFSRGRIVDWKEQINLISRYYSHAAGLTHLLMDLHPQKAAARNAYFGYLEDIYSGRPSMSDLITLLGADEVSAGLRYREAMVVTQEQLDWISAQANEVEQLVLAGSQLEDWTVIKRFPSLEWLDLSFSNFSSHSAQLLSDFARLKRLSLEGTKADGRVLEVVAVLPFLVDLDLTGCEIDDDDLQVLTDHQHLEILWLTQTAVTDRSLKVLGSLPRLRQCDISETAISADAWEKFLSEHPRVRPVE
jgi:hypothetical protein